MYRFPNYPGRSLVVMRHIDLKSSLLCYLSANLVVLQKSWYTGATGLPLNWSTEICFCFIHCVDKCAFDHVDDVSVLVFDCSSNPCKAEEIWRSSDKGELVMDLELMTVVSRLFFFFQHAYDILNIRTRPICIFFFHPALYLRLL